MHTVNDPQTRRALHAVYKTLYETHRASPAIFQPNDLTRLLTGLMGSRPWSWRVIGITPAALDVYAEHGYNKPPDKQIQRGHLRGRVDTARELFNTPEALDVDALFDFFLKRDRTVLMLVNENPSNSKKRPPPSFMPIDQDMQLFRCGSLVGYQHGHNETEYLRNLNTARPAVVTFAEWAAAELAAS